MMQTMRRKKKSITQRQAQIPMQIDRACVRARVRRDVKVERNQSMNE